MKKSLSFIDQIIEVEQARDKEYIKLCHLAHKSTKTLGESIIIKHLRDLKELIEKEHKEFAKNVHVRFQKPF